VFDAVERYVNEIGGNPEEPGFDPLRIQQPLSRERESRGECIPKRCNVMGSFKKDREAPGSQDDNAGEDNDLGNGRPPDLTTTSIYAAVEPLRRLALSIGEGVVLRTCTAVVQ
jgi:hypothetical protein